MHALVDQMEAQLAHWRVKIDHLAARVRIAGAPARFEDVMYIDELKALHAIAQSRLDEFRAATGTERALLESELKSAWDELGAAFKNPGPSP